MTTKSDVNAFLLKIKAKVLSGQLYFVPRNLAEIAILGITFDSVDDIILELTANEYCAGPEADRDGSPGEVWVFGALMGSIQIYIKFKMLGEDARCLSFHEAQASMIFPLR